MYKQYIVRLINYNSSCLVRDSLIYFGESDLEVLSENEHQKITSTKVLFYPNNVDYYSDEIENKHEMFLLIDGNTSKELLKMYETVVGGSLSSFGQLRWRVMQCFPDHALSKFLNDDEQLFAEFKRTKKLLLNNMVYLKLKEYKSQHPLIEWESDFFQERDAIEVIKNNNYSCSAFKTIAEIKDTNPENIAIETLIRIKNYNNLLYEIKNIYYELEKIIDGFDHIVKLGDFLVSHEFRTRADAIKDKSYQLEDFLDTKESRINKLEQEIKDLHTKLDKLNPKKGKAKKVESDLDSSGDEQYSTPDTFSSESEEDMTI